MRDAAPSGEGAATPAASNSRLTRAPAVANHDASRDLLLLAEHTGAEASLKAELERTCVAGSPPIASHSLILHGLSPFRVIALEAASAEALTVATALAGEKRAYSRPTRIAAHAVVANTSPLPATILTVRYAALLDDGAYAVVPNTSPYRSHSLQSSQDTVRRNAMQLDAGPQKQ